MNPENLPEFYANVIDSVGDGVIVLNTGGSVILINPFAEEIAGVSRRVGKGQPFSAMFRGEDALLEMVDLWRGLDAKGK